MRRRPRPWQFNVAGQIAHGRIDDSRLPHPLTDIRAAVRLSNQGFAVEDLTARSNQATLRLSARGKSLRPGAAALPWKRRSGNWSSIASCSTSCRKTSSSNGTSTAPTARSTPTRSWSTTGSAGARRLTVRCLNVSFTHHKFPYRLEHGTGTVTLADDVLQADLTAYSGNQPVHVDAKWQHPLSAPVGWMEVKGDDLPLDEKLLAALPERPRAVARALDLRGTINFRYNLWRQSPAGKRAPAPRRPRQSLLGPLREIPLLAWPTSTAR